MANFNQKRIALLVQTSTSWSRQVLAGVAEQALEKGVCEFWIEPRGFYESMTLPPDWAGDGIICRLTDQHLVDAIERRGLPAVNVSWLGTHSSKIPKVVSDEAACGKLAAEFLIERGWTNFGVVGYPPRLNYSGQVERAFCERLAISSLRSQSGCSHCRSLWRSWSGQRRSGMKSR
jgi:LacI family transcriptional regulator